MRSCFPVFFYVPYFCVLETRGQVKGIYLAHLCSYNSKLCMNQKYSSTKITYIIYHIDLKSAHSFPELQNSFIYASNNPFDAPQKFYCFHIEIAGVTRRRNQLALAVTEDKKEIIYILVYNLFRSSAMASTMAIYCRLFSVFN